METRVPDPREILKDEVFALNLEFTATGIRREDGLTAAQVEAEMAVAAEVKE